MIRQAAGLSSNLITEITAIRGLPHFNELENQTSKDTHLLIYFCDLWSYIGKHIHEENVKTFLNFLIRSRRSEISMIFEYHSFPFGLSKSVNDFFQLYLTNSTIIFLTRNVSDKSKLNLFKTRYLKNNVNLFDKAEMISTSLIEKSKNSEARPYVISQKDICQKFRFLRVDLFDENIFTILD